MTDIEARLNKQNNCTCALDSYKNSNTNKRLSQPGTCQKVVYHTFERIKAPNHLLPARKKVKA